MIKKASSMLETKCGVFGWVKSLVNPYFIAGSLCVLCVPIMNIYLLTGMSLYLVYSVSGLHYVFVFFGSYLFLKEKITFYHVVGIMLIAFGVTITVVDSGASAAG
jgi:drug/metabolite transporter (DMT)-like permease